MGIKTAVILIVVLGPLAVLQYHWVGKVSQAERERMASNLEASVSRFAEAFDRELTRAFLTFMSDMPEPGESREAHIRNLLDAWTNETEFPGLIDDVYWIDRSDLGDIEVSCFDRQSGSFQPAPESKRRDAVVAWLLNPTITASRHQPPFESQVINGILPAFQVPGEMAPGQRSPFGRMGWSRQLFRGDTWVVTLDLDTLTQVVFPELGSRTLNPGGRSDYEILVRGSAESPGSPRPVLFRSPSEANPQEFDAQASLFALRHFPELTSLLGFRDRGRSPDDASKSWRHVGRGPRGFFAPDQDNHGLWMIQVAHRAGSLEAAVRHTRWRNLCLNLGALAILALSISLIVRSTQRAKRLALQQLDFVAGVSHELLTPLSAIQSAAQNLADGVVTDPEKIRHYGTMIQNQGHRLNDMVEKVLDFAGMHSNQTAYVLEPLIVEDLVTEVMATCRDVLERAKADISAHISRDLPPIRGDREASRQILSNLITNAAKYAGDEPQIIVSANYQAKKRVVAVSVSDNGPGIPPDEISHLFEPFFRGRTARASQIHGTGLGLCLVRNMIRAQGGQVSFSRTDSGGSRFTVSWPQASLPNQDPRPEPESGV